jgi:PadR family transcriptional regulator, regulatory protein PadR
MPPVSPQLFQGTLDVLILQALTTGARHGYAIAEWLEATSDGGVQIEDAALYTALHKLEDRGWVSSEWGLSEKGKRAKFYKLTATGKTQLRHRIREWEQYVASIGKVLRTIPRLA